MASVIVGLSAYFHDSACCVLRDGELVAAAQEERFSRRKHDPALPQKSFRFCLEEAGLTVEDVDAVAFYEDPVKKLDRQLWMGLPELPLASPEALFRLDASRPERDIRELLAFEGPVVYVDHHEAHAASAYYFSGFSDAAVLTVDAVGEWATTSYGRAVGRDLELLEDVRFPHSLGLLYSAITAYLGFEVNDAEYKVMGLAPYGEPTLVEQVRELIEDGPGGDFRLELRYFDFLRPGMYTEALCELFGRPPRQPESELDGFTKDLARSVQVVLEEVLLAKVSYLHGLVPSENLCMAGGVALNCVAIEKIARSGPFARVFVQPAASDAGAALGAAAIAHVRHTGERPDPQPLNHVFLGPGFDDEAVARLLRPTRAQYEDFRGRQADLIETTVERLASGQVVGWFQGRMEFGPRALGNRSILADPRDAGMRDRINALVKKRESFRPFAPAVLAPRAAEHFDLDHAVPFMLETAPVRSPLELPAITHVDGSARVQTVERETNPRFYALLEAFEHHTGCPILLNTSFNLRGEPIVCSPVDALLCFVRSDLDCLVLGDFLLDRAGLPAAWLSWFRQEKPVARRAVPDSVYTLV